MISLPGLRSTKWLFEPGVEPGLRAASGDRPRSPRGRAGEGERLASRRGSGLGGRGVLELVLADPSPPLRVHDCSCSLRGVLSTRPSANLSDATDWLDATRVSIFPSAVVPRAQK